MYRKRCLEGLLLASLFCVPMPASGAEWSAGVGMGAVQVGTAGYFGGGPQLGVTFGGPSGPVLAIRNLLLLLPAGDSIGIDNQITVGGGFSTAHLTMTAGGLLAIYRIPTCGVRLCGAVLGVGPGGFAQLDIFVKPPFGITARGTLAWYGGASLVPSDDLAWSATTGPILRW